MLYRLIRYSCIYEANMSPALNRSSAMQRFKGSNAIEICDGITFDFYTGLPHIDIHATMMPISVEFPSCVLLFHHSYKILRKFYTQEGYRVSSLRQTAPQRRLDKCKQHQDQKPVQLDKTCDCHICSFARGFQCLIDTFGR